MQKRASNLHRVIMEPHVEHCPHNKLFYVMTSKTLNVALLLTPDIHAVLEQGQLEQRLNPTIEKQLHCISHANKVQQEFSKAAV